jgi:sortase A
MKIRVKNANRSLRWVEAFLLGASLAALCVWTASIVIPAAWERWASQKFDSVVHSTQPIPEKRLEINSLVGRLSIPRLHLTAMVREGDAESTLSIAAGHIPGTALPGQKGNVGVAGHRDAIFRGLREVRKDDVIQFETVEGNHLYQVEGTEIVKPTQVSVLKPGKHPELTLVTCYPFYYVGSAPDRFIVKAREITSSD